MLNKNAFFIFSLCFFALNANAQTLPEVLAQAYKTNPTIKASKNNLQSIDENVAIARSGYRPTVAIEGSYSYLDRDSELNNVTTNQKTDADSIGIGINQSLFSGFQTVNAVRSSKYLVKAAQSNFYNVEQSVLLDASVAYLNLLKNSSVVKLQENNEKLLKQRLDETLKRFDVGEVTRTDVSQAKARHAEAVADTINAKGQLEVSKANYIRIIGQEPNTLSEPTFLNGFLPKSLDEAVDFSKNNNFSVKEAKDTYTSKAYTVAQKTGALLPSVNLNASASQSNNSIDNGVVVNDTEGEDLQVGVNVSVPIYDAGLDRAMLRQSKYQKAQALDNVIEAKRQAISDTTSAYQLMYTAKAQLEAFDAQIEANQLALDGVQKEEALGNRTLLNVLDAYQELLNSEVNKETAKESYYASSLELLYNMGKLTARDLALEVNIYDPKVNYKKTRGKWLSTSVNED